MSTKTDYFFNDCDTADAFCAQIDRDTTDLAECRYDASPVTYQDGAAPVVTVYGADTIAALSALSLIYARLIIAAEIDANIERGASDEG